jgi:hypothetical protein
MYRREAPTLWFAYVFALAGGALLARSDWLSGGILVALALICTAGRYFDKSDSSGLYPW